MVSPRIIIVRKDNDGRAFEGLRIAIPPFASAVWAARCRDAKIGESIDGLLAFGNEDRLIVGDRFEQRRQAIENSPCITEFPDPAAIAVRSALDEFLWRISLDLEQKIAVFVGVVVLRNDVSVMSVRAIGFAVPRRKPELRANVILASSNVITGMTENDKPSVFAKLDGKGPILRAVVWSWR